MAGFECRLGGVIGRIQNIPVLKYVSTVIAALVQVLVREVVGGCPVRESVSKRKAQRVECQPLAPTSVFDA